MRFCGMCATSAVACLIAVSVAGCQQSPYELAPVHGTVTIDGRPVSQAKIMFAPVENADNANPGKPAFGLLREDGSYALTTYETDDGAVVGEHWVTLVNLERDAQAAPAKRERRSTDVSSFTQMSVPRRVTVVPGKENQIDITLTRQDVARYGVVADD
jgi:hypothetical protein